MNLQNILLRMILRFGVEGMFDENSNDILSVDLRLSARSSESPLRSLNADGYSALDADESVVGGKVVAYILCQSKQRTDLLYDADEIADWLTLALGRELKEKEVSLVKNVTRIFNFADDYRIDDDDIWNLLMRMISKNSAAKYILAPVQVCLFILYGSSREKTEFIETLKALSVDCDEFAEEIDYMELTEAIRGLS